MRGQHIDYNLHGIVGIRLVDASAADAAIVTQQLGPIRATLAREPDIFIRFVDRLPISSRVRYLGVDDVGFTDDAFLILRSKHKTRAKVQIPFDRIGRQCEIVCERGLPAVPMLIAIVNLTVLGKGALPLHASAFTYNDMGVLVTGWAKGGKTETLLGFMARGAAYVGDEWIYMGQDGRMYGIPEPIRVWDWHLREAPQYQALISQSDRAKLHALRLAVRGIDLISGNVKVGKALVGKTLRRIMPVLTRQQYVHLPPLKTFGEKFCALKGRPDKVFFVISHEAPDIIVQPIDPQEIARRMVFSLQDERRELISYYTKFRFAFPEWLNNLIEEAQVLQLDALKRLLRDKEAYVVFHPYPVSISTLFDAISPYCQRTTGQAATFPAPTTEAVEVMSHGG
jgi:hypothetical protein